MKQEKKAVCTIAMIVINITIFLVLSFQGMTEDGIFMFHHGAMYVPSMLEDGEYYRLFTSMFLHFGFEHLMNNMFILGVIGWNLELEIGKWKYLAVYLLSGLMGNLLSAWMDIQTGEYAISAGASGAIFGVIGALFYVALRNRGRIGNISSRGLAFMVLCSLYLGFTSIIRLILVELSAEFCWQLYCIIRRNIQMAGTVSLKRKRNCKGSPRSRL